MGTHGQSIQIKRIHTIAQWSLGLCIVLLPWQTRWIALPGILNNGPWEYGTVSVYAIDLLLLLIFSLGILLREKKKAKEPSDTAFLVVALLILAFLSMGEAINRINALFWFGELAKGVLLFFSIGWIKPSAILLTRACLASALIQSLLIHWQFFVQRVHGNTWLGMATQDPHTLGVTVIEVAGERFLRAYGSLPHPNIAGIFVAIGLVAAIVLFGQARSLPQRIVLGATIVLTSSAVWLTFSRQAWIAAAVMCSVLVFSVFWRERRFPALASIALLLALIPSIVWTAVHPELTATRFSATERLEQQSIDQRETHLEESKPIIQSHWVEGIGIGNYTAYLHAIDRKNDIERPSYAYQPVHTIYLLILAELGIGGLVIFLLFVISLLIPRKEKNSPPRPRGQSETGTWNIFWKISLIGLLTVGLFDHYLWSLPVGITLFWLVAGLTAMPNQKSFAASDE